MKLDDLLKGTQLQNRVQRGLLDLLSDVPFLHADFIPWEDLGLSGVALDGALHLRLPAGDVVAAIEIKSSGEISLARQAAFHFARWRELFLTNSVATQTGTQSSFSGGIVPGAPPFALPYGIFVAPFISPGAAALCRELGIGYFDLAGNCCLSFGQVYIRRENWPNPAKRQDSPRTLWAPKAQRVLRTLLENPRRTWKTQSLAGEAQVSMGLISNVRSQLTDRERVESKDGGFALVEPAELLKEWAQAFHSSRKPGGEYLFYSLDSLPQIESKLVRWCEENDTPFALTEFAGAARLASYVRYNQVTGYISGDVGQIAPSLGLRRVETGANVRLIVPRDPGVFYGQTISGGVPIVSATQLYLDLRAMGGRGNDAAEFLFDKVIAPRWNSNET